MATRILPARSPLPLPIQRTRAGRAPGDTAAVLGLAPERRPYVLERLTQIAVAHAATERLVLPRVDRRRGTRTAAQLATRQRSGSARSRIERDVAIRTAALELAHESPSRLIGLLAIRFDLSTTTVKKALRDPTRAPQGVTP